MLDLGAPGISFTSLGNGVQFDMNGDGVPGQVAWTTGEDGILAYDLNGSGTIENGSEIFSPYFAGGHFADGLAALASLDTQPRRRDQCRRSGLRQARQSGRI